MHHMETFNFDTANPYAINDLQVILKKAMKKYMQMMLIFKLKIIQSHSIRIFQNVFRFLWPKRFFLEFSTTFFFLYIISCDKICDSKSTNNHYACICMCSRQLVIPI